MTEVQDIQQSLQSSVRIDDVARTAGVSAATVSRVLNNRGKYSRETRARVMEVIRELGYQKYMASRAPAQGKMKAIGLVLPAFNSDFVVSLAQAVTDAATAAGYQIIMTFRSEGFSPRPLGRYATDGVLVFSNRLAESEMRTLVAERCPTVLLYREPPSNIRLPCVTIDNRTGTHEVVSHLLRVHRCRRMVHLRGPYGNPDALVRESTYRQALLEHGLEVDSHRIRPGEDAATAFASTCELIKEGTAFDAVFAWSDDAAKGAIDALRGAGKSVPGDVRVVGFDDAPIAERLDPQLTTVRTPIKSVARHAVEQLVLSIEGREATPKVRLPVELVIRRSCGCAS